MINLLLLTMVFLPMVLGLVPIFIKDTKKLNFGLVILCFAEFIAGLWLVINNGLYSQTTVALSWFSGLGISFKLNGLGLLLTVATALVWACASVFAKEYFEKNQQNLGRFYGFFSVSFGATLGIFLAGDLFTLFVFFEIMSFAAYALVVHNQDTAAIVAGNSYLTITVLGGLVSLMGIFMLNSLTGTLALDQLPSACAALAFNPQLPIAGFLIFFGFAAKAGLFPLHGWLPKAYPAAPAPATIVLSSVLSKVGVYGCVIVTLKLLLNNKSWGLLLLFLGVCTMLIGGVFALISTDVKETLAYSSMSQIGFITVGLAMTAILGGHGAVAASGTVLHMINHTLFKLVLFICAGLVFKNLGKLDLNSVKGYGKDKPLLKVTFALAALGLMGVPGFSGYISKTLLHEGIVEQIHLVGAGGLFSGVEVLFLISGGLTVAYMLKLFVCLFVESPEKTIADNKTYASPFTKMILALAGGAVLVCGLLPHLTMDKISSFASGFMGAGEIEEAINYFSLTNLKGAIISITIGLILYFVVVRKLMTSKTKEYKTLWNKSWSLESKVFRPILFNFLPFVGGFFSRVLDVMTDSVVFVINRLFCKSVPVPVTFFEGKEQTIEQEARRNSQISITRSLAYSLLLFGLGFVMIMLYLLVSEFRV